MNLIREHRVIYDTKYTWQVGYTDEDVASAKFDILDLARKQINHAMDRIERSMICFHNGHGEIISGHDMAMCLFCRQVFPE